jgi:serine O-acetyltransferase
MEKYSTLVRILYAIQFLRAVLHIFLFKTSTAKPVIEKDINRWVEEYKYTEYRDSPKWKALVWFLWRYPEFRNLFYYRIVKESHLAGRMLLEVAKLLYRRMNTLYIYSNTIGEGLFIQHGFSTIIGAEVIGKNCWINQEVTLGFVDENGLPILGDNVHITAGAKVLGGVTIGDNSIVGANAVVVKDVPPNCTVVGIPAFIIRRNGKRVKEPL